MTTVPDYSLCGWRVRSDLTLPQMAQWRGDGREPDIQIREQLAGELSRPRTGRQLGVLSHVCEDGSLLLEMPGLASFWISQGQQIGITRCTDVRTSDLVPLILGPVMGVICAQRQLVPLRATVVEREGEGLLICGNAGTGKSAVAYLLTRRGYRLVSDGLSVLRLNRAEQTLYALPTCPTFWFWNAAVACLQIPATLAAAGRRNIPKRMRAVEFNLFNLSTEVPVRRVVLLSAWGRLLPAMLRRCVYVDRLYETALSKADLEESLRLLVDQTQAEVSGVHHPARVAQDILGARLASQRA